MGAGNGKGILERGKGPYQGIASTVLVCVCVCLGDCEYLGIVQHEARREWGMIVKAPEKRGGGQTLDRHWTLL